MHRPLQTYLLFGGAGLVGMATCRRIARELAPKRVVVASLKLTEAEAAVAELRNEHPEVDWVPEAGNLFVPTEFASMGRGELLGNTEHRRTMLEQIFGPFEQAYERNHLAVVIRRHRPDAIVDCVNTATGISYQDVFESTALLRDDLARYLEDTTAPSEDLPRDLESGLL